MTGFSDIASCTLFSASRKDSSAESASSPACCALPSASATSLSASATSSCAAASARAASDLASSNAVSASLLAVSASSEAVSKAVCASLTLLSASLTAASLVSTSSCAASKAFRASSRVSGADTSVEDCTDASGASVSISAACTATGDIPKAIPAAARVPVAMNPVFTIFCISLFMSLSFFTLAVNILLSAMVFLMFNSFLSFSAAPRSL